MLVLSRKLMEQIVVGDELMTITVLELGPGRVRLGFDAPIGVRIRRQELAADQALTNPIPQSSIICEQPTIV